MYTELPDDNANTSDKLLGSILQVPESNIAMHANAWDRVKPALLSSNETHFALAKDLFSTIVDISAPGKR